MQCILLLDCVRKLCAGFEFSHLLSGNLNLLFGCRVDTFTCGALGYAECAEADQLYFVTSHKPLRLSLHQPCSNRLLLQSSRLILICS